jgi:hypothetical protein
LIPDVDDDGPRHRIDGDPFVILADLEAIQILVLKQNCKAPVVGVAMCPQHKVGPWAWRIVVCSEEEIVALEHCG